MPGLYSVHQCKSPANMQSQSKGKVVYTVTGNDEEVGLPKPTGTHMKIPHATDVSHFITDYSVYLVC